VKETLCSINWDYVIAIISIVASFVISTIAILSTKGNAKKERLIDIVTSNRMDWIQKLKEYLSAYLSLVYFHYEKKLPEDENKFITDINELAFKIKLHLNFKGKADIQIEKLLDEINTAYEKFFMYKSSGLGVMNTRLQPDDYLTFIGKLQLQYSEIYTKLYSKTLQEIGIDLINDSKDEIEKKISSIGLEKFQSYMKDLIIISDFDLKKSVRIIKYSYHQLFIISRVYLKTEWERVKVEAGSGSLLEYNFDEKFESNISEMKKELKRWETLKNPSNRKK